MLGTTTMKYYLSFCEIEQLSEHVFEVTINDGVEIDEKCAQEGEEFWYTLRKEPYSLLVNNKNSFSFSFLGAQKIGDHALEKRTAILVNDTKTKHQMSVLMELKKFAGDVAMS